MRPREVLLAYACDNGQLAKKGGQAMSTMFLQSSFFLVWAAQTIRRDGTIRLPFGSGRTSSIDTRDVAEVIAAILEKPAGHVGKVYELTGPKSQDLHGLAAEYATRAGPARDAR